VGRSGLRGRVHCKRRYLRASPAPPAE
jgi:hypothetical protein